MTQIQELRHRVVLLRRRIAEEADGSFQEFWEETDPVWAKITPCFSREILGEGWNKAAPPHARYKVTMRNRQGRFSRIQWDDKILALLCPPLKDPHQKWMTCFMYEIGEDIGENHE
jgi:head-tail adaptor